MSISQCRFTCTVGTLQLKHPIKKFKVRGLKNKLELVKEKNCNLFSPASLSLMLSTDMPYPFLLWSCLHVDSTMPFFVFYKLDCFNCVFSSTKMCQFGFVALLGCPFLHFRVVMNIKEYPVLAVFCRLSFTHTCGTFFCCTLPAAHDLYGLIDPGLGSYPSCFAAL
jgi:hypothetical protein